MQPVNIGVIGLGNVGLGTLDILAGNAASIASKLGFPLEVRAVCSRSVAGKNLPAPLAQAARNAQDSKLIRHVPVPRSRSTSL